MKRVVWFGFLILTLACAMVPVQAAVIVNVNFDEFGKGTTDFQTPLHTLPGGLVADPSGGLGVNVLAYALPFVAVQGDVRLNEVVGSTVILSDIVRFFTVANATLMIFYSDNGDGVDAPADTGLPQNALTNVVTIQENGPEGANGAIYTPTAGQPGFFNSDNQSVYNIVSDSSVPEPGSMLLMAAGLGLLIHYRRKLPI